MKETVLADRWLGMLGLFLFQLKELVFDPRADYVDLEMAGRLAYVLRQYYEDIEKKYAYDDKKATADES